LPSSPSLQKKKKIDNWYPQRNAAQAMPNVPTPALKMHCLYAPSSQPTQTPLFVVSHSPYKHLQSEHEKG